MIAQTEIQTIEVNGRPHLTHYRVIDVAKTEDFVSLSLDLETPAKSKFNTIVKDYRPLTIEAAKLENGHTKEAQLQKESILMAAIAESARIVVIQKTIENDVSAYINLYPATNTNNELFLLSQTTFITKEDMSLYISNNSLWCIVAENALHKKRKIVLTSITSNDRSIIIHQFSQDGSPYGFTVVSDHISRISASQAIKSFAKTIRKSIITP